MLLNKTKLSAGTFHFINHLKKTLFLKTSLSFLTPTPQSVYLIPGSECNSHCIMCLNWLFKKKQIPFSIWKKVIDDINKLSPYTKINISGGEVLIPGEMLKTVNYSISKLPYTGITSNGFFIDKKMARSLVSKGFSNINISFDGITKNTVNLIRGRSFAYDKTKKAIVFLINERNQQKSKAKIIVKTVIMGLNFKELIKLVHWIKRIGADGIYFQPIGPIYGSNKTMKELKKSSLWIKEREYTLLVNTIHKFIQMKKNGYPILNDFEHLDSIINYFDPNKVENKTHANYCDIDTTSLFIVANGDVHFCLDSFPPIGNVLKNSLDKIMNSKKAIFQRRLIRKCGKASQCLSTCLYKKSLFQQAKMFLFLK